ncbi:MAG: hypothetical protein A3J27_04705 [Candidatus Tectomicrobia bacterium RIFCSPLOWO2_12_FULL_69_37]|nr:MAG: hypothetical protein A3J27_04705 [Candidatus Tectomicrobia bacterium RIFCSPLOWO2_12_FULL_69_37]OGL61457.1 MAG: hypothetical protein A3I72_16630 [Candidatus Tectomicrobia bacterium RIFCSPLOWO2_02_FULL_70_19]
MDRRADPRKWARLLFCAAFYLIATGLAGAILTHALGVPRPGKILFLPSLAVAFAAGWFYAFDRPGSRLAEAGNLAGALTALRLWEDLAWLQPASGLSAWGYFAAWWTWGSYLGNAAVIMLAGWWMEGRR